MSSEDFQSLAAMLERMDRKIDMLRRELDFVRTHSSSYLGSQIALTHLVDDTPMFVNANDFGGPANLISGGRYEEENLAVLLSYVEPNTLFLDVGANLGFFSLKIARRVAGFGKVLAFEPHPLLGQLLKRSVHLNGMSSVITHFPIGLSNRNESAQLLYPDGHLGGGGVMGAALIGAVSGATIIEAELKRLDDIVPDDFQCDLMKVDVEGHELSVFRGMEQVLNRSPRLKILFEKLGTSAGYEQQLQEFFAERGFCLFEVGDDRRLVMLDDGALPGYSGYVLAARPSEIGSPDRNRFSIYPSQLFVPGVVPGLGALRCAGDVDHVYFHGPYWFLPRGVWRLRIFGENRSGMRLTLAARFGVVVSEHVMEAGCVECDVVAHEDLVHFELIGRNINGSSIDVTIERLELLRVG